MTIPQQPLPPKSDARVIAVCSCCGKDFSIQLAVLEQGRDRFCSTDCMASGNPVTRRIQDLERALERARAEAVGARGAGEVEGAAVERRRTVRIVKRRRRYYSEDFFPPGGETRENRAAAFLRGLLDGIIQAVEDREEGDDDDTEDGG